MTTTTTTKRANKRATNALASANDTNIEHAMTIVAMCEKHKRDPKIIRAKARRMREQLIPHLFEATSDERWRFKASSIEHVEALLFKRA